MFFNIIFKEVNNILLLLYIILYTIRTIKYYEDN